MTRGSPPLCSAGSRCVTAGSSGSSRDPGRKRPATGWVAPAVPRSGLRPADALRTAGRDAVALLAGRTVRARDRGRHRCRRGGTRCVRLVPGRPAQRAGRGRQPAHRVRRAGRHRGTSPTARRRTRHDRQDSPVQTVPRWATCPARRYGGPPRSPPWTAAASRCWPPRPACCTRWAGRSPGHVPERGHHPLPRGRARRGRRPDAGHHPGAARHPGVPGRPVFLGGRHPASGPARPGDRRGRPGRVPGRGHPARPGRSRHRDLPACRAGSGPGGGLGAALYREPGPARRGPGQPAVPGAGRAGPGWPLARCSPACSSPSAASR